MEDHTDKEQFQSSECHKAFRWGNCKVKHMREHSGETSFQHSEYSKLFIQKSLAELMKIHNEVKQFPCSECDKSFSRSVSLVQHLRIHAGEKPYQCSECSKSFARRSYLVEHKRVHTGEKPYHCSVCHKAFRQKSNQVTHMNVHTGRKPYQCSECEKFFSLKGSLVQHMKIHTGEKFQCSECSKSFSRKVNLKRHMTNHTGEKLQCSECNKSFHWRTSLVRHMKIHFATNMKNHTEEKSKCLEIQEGQLVGEKPTFWNGTDKPFTCDENSQGFDHKNCQALYSKGEHVQSSWSKLKLSQSTDGDYMIANSEVMMNCFGEEVKKEDVNNSDSTIWKSDDPVKFEIIPESTIKEENVEDCIFVKEELWL